MSKYAKSVGSWNPGPGKGPDAAAKAKLFSTTASDHKDSISGTNEQKPFLGKSGKPPGPFGVKGREF